MRLVRRFLSNELPETPSAAAGREWREMLEGIKRARPSKA